MTTQAIPRRPVGHSDCGKTHRLPRQQVCDARIHQGWAYPRTPDERCHADHQQATKILVAHLGDPTHPLLASARVLQRVEAEPGSELPARSELLRIGDRGSKRGSIISVTNSSGIGLAINTYDEFGIPSLTAYSGRYGYTGQAWIPSAQRWHYKARAYHPGLGRFLQPDPIGYAGDGPNLYAYVLNDPVNLVDPLGAISEIIVIGNLPHADGGGLGGLALAILTSTLGTAGSSGVRGRR